VLTVDENGMRTLLRDMAETEIPPARVDLDQAIAAGGRQRRIRLARTGGSVLAAGAAIGAVVAMAVVPSPRTAPATTPRPPGPPAVVIGAPARFDPLVPYAAFGWLPAGYLVGTEQESVSTTQSIQLAGTHPDGSGLIRLTVDAKGACTGSPPRSLTCPGTNGSTLSLGSLERAPDVNGRSAYWAPAEHMTGGYLAWQYAPGAWAAVQTLAPGDRAVIERVAAHVRYDVGTPLTVPFWVRLPAGWTAGEAAFSQGPSGALLGNQISAGPVYDSEGLDLVATPSNGTSGCKGTPNTTLDGAPATLQTPGGAAGGYQYLCAADVDGLSVYTAVYYALTSAGNQPILPGGALALARDMHLLGGRVPDWTNHPLR
jgi:hypothetical protein